MVGSLSVIRFRTAIKDPADLMYLFILIMIGLGCGTQNYLITFLAAGLMAAILFAISGDVSHLSKDHVVIIKDKQTEQIEAFIQQIRARFPETTVAHLSLKEDAAEASLTLREIDEKWFTELRQKMKIQQLVILKK
jgi:uncharacterized membrane protein YhiD involved in acid resistance